MINPTSIHCHTIRMGKEEFFENFFDRLSNELEKFERVTHKGSDDKLYRRELISRIDVYSEKRFREIHDSSVIEYTVRERVKVILKYRCKPT